MDFFEAQARAKKRTSRLVVLFGCAVLGTILAAYAAAFLIVRGSQEFDLHRARDPRSSYYGNKPGTPVSYFDARLFAGVALVTISVVGIASIFKWHQFSGGGSAVAESVNGRRIDPHTTDLNERRLLNVVEEMAIASGVPVPDVYVLPDEPAINAFAAGLTTNDAVVAVTRGTLEKLSRDELQGVVAHEFSHILNGDMRLNMRLTALVFGILVLGLAGRGILWSMRNVRVRGKGGGPVAALALAGVALLIIGYIGYFFGRLVQAAVSRQREFLADASAVQFTRNPNGIAGALKKIGGYALGSSITAQKSEAIGHFFFAQGFRSMFGGLWATHPPLPDRIRAIEPQFDGEMFDPPQVVDIARESFASAGFGGGQRLTPDETVRRAFAAPAEIPPPRAPLKIPYRPAAAMDAVAAIGSLTAAQISNAQELLDATPERLRAAAHTAAEAPVLVFGLLLDAAPGLQSRQRALIAARAGADAAGILESLGPALQAVRPEQRLPLLQIALPTLRDMPAAALEPFLDTLDELVHIDARLSTFEFALQKMLMHALALGRQPGAVAIRYHSFNALVDEISIVLSALARASVSDPRFAARAFASGAGQLKLIESRLRFVDEAACSFESLDAALDKLAAASLPIKQRTLMAAAHVVSADGQVLITEAELLRAIAAALDCPMPPLSAAA
jgi:Zn-dependent protease with chaperone function